MPSTSITYRRIRQINAALTALSARTLPTITSDLKVAKAIRKYFRGHVEDTDAAIRKIREDTPAPEGVEGHELPVALMESRQRQIDELLDKEVEDFPEIPDSMRITEADLPKTLKTGAAEENRAGVADIIVNLDFLYAHPSEE